jgi:hypothetical protein
VSNARKLSSCRAPSCACGADALSRAKPTYVGARRLLLHVLRLSPRIAGDKRPVRLPHVAAVALVPIFHRLIRLHRQCNYRALMLVTCRPAAPAQEEGML